MPFHYLLMKTHFMFSRKILQRAKKELGLSSGQPKVLDCLLTHEGSDQKTIATICEIEQATLGSILNRMEEKGLIERRQQKENRRSWFVYLTEYGKEMALKMNQIFEQEDGAVMAALTAEEQETLNSLLQKICQKIG